MKFTTRSWFVVVFFLCSILSSIGTIEVREPVKQWTVYEIYFRWKLGYAELAYHKGSFQFIDFYREVPRGEYVQYYFEYRGKRYQFYFGYDRDMKLTTF